MDTGRFSLIERVRKTLNCAEFVEYTYRMACTLLLILAMSSITRAQVQVDFTVATTDVIRIGQPTALTFHWIGPRDTELVSSPATLVTTALIDAGLEILDQDRQQRDLPEQRREDVLSTSVSAYTTGTFTVPALTVSYRSPGEEVKSLRTQPISLQITSVLQPEDLLEIRGPGQVGGFDSGLPKKWIALGIGLFSILLILFHMFRKPATPPPPPPPKPPYDEAIENLNALLGEHLIDKGQIKEHCDRLSDVVRFYLTRLELSSMDQTTDELLSGLDSSHMALGSFKSLKGILETCDSAKFARYEPGQRFLDDLTDRTRSFLELTRPRHVTAALATTTQVAAQTEAGTTTRGSPRTDMAATGQMARQPGPTVGNAASEQERES